MNALQYVFGFVALSFLVHLSAFAQNVLPAPDALLNVSGCAVEGGDVFITTGQGTDLRRFKYAWDKSIDAVCNAKGFAISTPKEASAQAGVNPSPPAPGVLASDFPAESPKPSADMLKQRLSDKKFVLRESRGNFQIEYKANGYFFGSTSAGFGFSGKWRTEDGKLCSQLNGEPMTCSEVRERGDGIVVKRQSGEVVSLTSR